MDLTQLEYFRMAATLGHFTRAANELHITQPALSKTIANLETELGVKLFDRDGKRIRLNAYGEVVLRYTDQIFDALSQMNQEISDLSDGIAGNIRMAVSTPIRDTDPVLDELLFFMKDYPNIQISYNHTNQNVIRAELLNGSLDLAMTSSALSSREITWIPLYEDRLGIILSRNHPLAQKEELCMADLENENFFCNNADNDSRNSLYDFCAQAGFEPKVRFEGQASLAIGQWISEGLGISFIPEEQFRLQYIRDVEMGIRPWSHNITFRPVSDPYCVQNCGLAYLKSRYQTEAVRQLCARLIKRFQKIDTESPEQM